MASDMDNRDSEDLEALFDNIAASKQSESQGETPAAEEDSEEDLESLFDSIAAEQRGGSNDNSTAEAEPEPADDKSEPRDSAASSDDVDFLATYGHKEAETDAVDAEATETSSSSAPPEKEVAAVNPDDVDDEDEEALEALFDSIAAEKRDDVSADDSTATGQAQSDATPSDSHLTESENKGAKSEQEKEMINRIGHLTRTLHNTLHELGLQQQIEKVASTIPDTRGRLDYVASLTGQAAERVLNATDTAQPVVEKMEQESAHLSMQWDLLFEKKLDVMQFKELVNNTQAFLKNVPQQTQATNTQLVEIMLAQEFQDLTGQVIKKITDLINDVEQQLLALLVDNVPPEKQEELKKDVLSGPVTDAEGRTDVVTSQDQVDDLLESLGF